MGVGRGYIKGWRSKKQIARLRLELKSLEARGHTPLQPTESAGMQRRSASRPNKLGVWCVAVTPSCPIDERLKRCYPIWKSELSFRSKKKDLGYQHVIEEQRDEL
jgi:hypothetical protein